MIFLPLGGMLLSILAGYLTIVYAGYSNWNWASADHIARGRPGWPHFHLITDEAKSSWIAREANKRGRPCNPSIEVAPVFRYFLRATSMSLLSHAFLLGVVLRDVFRR
jgi:hypothetical protein